MEKRAETDQLEQLIERLKHGRCVLCAGSRLTSGNEGAFRGLVEKLLKKVPGVDSKEAATVMANRPLAAAGFVRRRLGDSFVPELKKLAKSQKDLPEAVKLFGELPFRAIVTTSYDDTFERAFTRGQITPRVYTPSDHSELRRDGKARFVFKALGDIAREETVVWSASDLQHALADGGYRMVAHELYGSRSFLFVGFDGHDPDLGILLERVLSGAKANDVVHYAILPGLTEMEREELHAAYGINVLPIDDVTQLARALKEAIGDDQGQTLPDDDDVEGWLALLTEHSHREDLWEKLREVEQRLHQKKEWDKLVELNLGRVDLESAGANRANVLLAVALLFENQLADPGKAFTALIAAYKEHPGEMIWQELERVTVITDAWSDLLEELNEIIPSLPEGDPRAEGWVRIARLHSEKMGNQEHALTALGQALKINSGLPAAAVLRVDILRRTTQFGDLAQALAAQIATTDDAKVKAELYIELGDLYENRLNDGAKAVSNYREAMAADPTAMAATMSLEALLRRRGEFQPLVELLEENVKRLSGDEARQVMLDIADLLGEKIGDRKGAITRYETLRKQTPGDLQILRALEKLYETEGKHDQYLATLADQAEAAQSDKERAALYRRLGAEWVDFPGGGPRAAEFLEKLIALDPRSEDAFRSLEQIYRNEHNWQSLVEALRRHSAIVPPAIRADLYAQTGAIFEEELRDVNAAIEAYQNVESAQPNHEGMLSALTRLYEKSGAYDKSLEIIEKRAQSAETKAQRVELYHRAGEITAERLGDSKAAEAKFVRALEIDPTYVPSMTALVEIYRKNGDFLRAAKLLNEAVPHTTNRLEKTRLLVEAGEIYQGLEDPNKAIELLTEALSVDPEHVEAGERLSELLWQAERWAEVVPVLEMLTRKENDPSLQIDRLSRLGQAALKIGANEKAQKAFARASQIDPTNLEAQRGRANWHFQRQEWAEALSALTHVHANHASGLPPAEQVELMYALGTCELKLGNKESAKGWLDQALFIDPTHRPSLLAQMELGESSPEAAIEAKKALLTTANDDEKAKLLGEIGDVYLEKLNDPPQAIGAFREALEIKPNDQKLLNKCLNVYSEQRMWSQAIEMVDRLIAIEKLPGIRAKYRHVAGLINRDELGKPEEAAKVLAEALDDDPNFERAAQALEELLNERQEWKELTRYFRKSIKRLGPDAADGKNPERLRLWSAMGDVCFDKLGERESALAAYEVALTFDPKNMDRHKKIADLYVQAGPDSFEKAIGEHQIILRAEKQRVLSYRALKHLYIQTQQRDKSVACSYALVFLKKSEPDDVKKLDDWKKQPQPQPRRQMNDEMWLKLAHPDEDAYLSTLFQVVSPIIASAQAQPHKNLNLNRKEALEANDPRPFAKALRQLAGTLGVSTPECYVRPDQKESVIFFNCIDKQTLVPVFALGQPIVQPRSERDLTIELTRKLALLRPERILRWVLPQPAQLAHVIIAAITIGQKQEGTGELQKTVQALKKALTPVQFEQVASIGRKLSDRGEKPEAAALAWIQATELTSARAGLAIGGDLESTARIVAGDPQLSTSLPATQRLLDVVWSSVTEEVAAVRKHLGLIS